MEVIYDNQKFDGRGFSIHRVKNPPFLTELRADDRVKYAPFEPAYYVVCPTTLLSDLYIAQVASLAADETIKNGVVNDLDRLPNPEQFSYDKNLFLLTHSLEHLSAIELANLSLSALFALTTEGQSLAGTAFASAETQPTPFIGFSFRKNLVPDYQYQVEAIRRSCLKIETF
jgi:hypothetical protein